VNLAGPRRSIRVRADRHAAGVSDTCGIAAAPSRKSVNAPLAGLPLPAAAIG